MAPRRKKNGFMRNDTVYVLLTHDQLEEPIDPNDLGKYMFDGVVAFGNKEDAVEYAKRECLDDDDNFYLVKIDYEVVGKLKTRVDIDIEDLL